MRKWEQRKDGTNRKPNSKMTDLNPSVPIITLKMRIPSVKWQRSSTSFVIREIQVKNK